jgi:general secretion pathway protein G
MMKYYKKNLLNGFNIYLAGNGTKKSRHKFRKRNFLLLILIASIIYPVSPFVYALKQSKVSAAEARIGGISAALDSFRLDVGRYPNTYEGLSALYDRPNSVSSEMWKGPYLLKRHLKEYILTDPWWQDYRYISEGIHNKDSFDLFSIGRDGIEGTVDDINNWDESQSWREHYRKSWYWSDLGKSWHWYYLWHEYKFFVISFSLILLVSVLVEVVREKRQKNKRA